MLVPPRSPSTFPPESGDDSNLRSKQPLRVVNLFGAPGMGKSSIASGLYYQLKKMHESVELCREYAKYLVISSRHWQLREEQLYLFAKQHHELFILRGNYRMAITDSPLPLTAFYAAPDATPESFYQCVADYNATFDNLNFVVTRDLKANGSVFEEAGRVHDRTSAIVAEQRQRTFLSQWGIETIDVNLDMEVDPVHTIFNHLQERQWLQHPRIL